MKKLLLTILLSGFLTSLGFAQYIAVKSVPVATGDQFLLFPSTNAGMGGVSIALDDELLDPFTNPARSSASEGSQFMSTPLFYSISMNDDFSSTAPTGRASTIPVGFLSKTGNKFNGVMLAWQQLSIGQPDGQTFFEQQGNNNDIRFSSTSRPAGRSKAINNLYAFFTSGFDHPDKPISLGISVTAAMLNGVEGVRLLYAQGNNVNQEGLMAQIRAGLSANLSPNSTLDAVLLHHRFKMVHDLGDREEDDETNGIGLDINYTLQMEQGWTFGGQMTTNIQWHPKIPNYDLMQIPRDPGNTSAFNMGIGIARKVENITYGIDLIYEPIWSHTWADAIENIELVGLDGNPTGEFLFAGEKAVENYFQFNNRIVRFGITQTGKALDVQFGADLHTIRYHLDQTNYEEQFSRSQNESWNEWTLNAGLVFKFSAIQIRYLGRIAFGTGQPGIAFNNRWEGCPTCSFNDSGFIIAPAGRLLLDEAKVFTSQVTIQVPLNGKL